MEGEVGAQVAVPIAMQQSFPSIYHGSSSVSKKRDLAWHNANFHPNPNSNWNPKFFKWDSMEFSVKKSSNEGENTKNSANSRNLEREGESLTLKLGDSGLSLVDEDRVAVRPSKKVRAGSPGSMGGGNYPMCQVDDCKTNLSNAKDYHRRHKVCEIHSKITQALVGKQMQRFCQQCSRFHPLSEFDEGKRSCRRRLAGHNKRRRKTQPEDTSSKLISPIDQGSNTNNLDIVKLLAILARLQGADKVAEAPTISDRNQVNQIINKIQSLQAANSVSRSSVAPEPFDLNVSQISELPSFETPTKVIGNQSLKSLEVSKVNVEKSRPRLTFQLFHTDEDDDITPQVGPTRKSPSSESSNPVDDRSPSTFPVAQKLFPMHSGEEWMPNNGNAHNKTTMAREWVTPLRLFKESERRVDNGAVQILSCQAGYTSSSGSDHSPSSSNSYEQDRTGRIIFKLFDKDPSSFPGALKSQILNWLSNSPSEIESYIRPGCVVLSVYASMPFNAWDALEQNLLQKISVLCSESEFWKSGRFLVRTNRQLVSHKDGNIRLCKFWKTLTAPVLTSVSPIAIVSGQNTSFVLKGRNLTSPGTRIHCSYMGGYISKDVLCSAYSDTIYDESSMECFNFHGGALNTFGRCFIEVEKGFKGNSFPVIIADAAVCQELRILESYIEGDKSTNIQHFLNELGWLFQRKNIPLDPLTNIPNKRFRLLLTFSVEHDWPVLVKTILDMLVERSIVGENNLVQESLEMLLETQLLSRAVKRKCRKMVDLLINYSVKGRTNDSNIYLFPPNSAGSGGITPLHVAASTQDTEDMVDALTNDPQEIGLNSWNSILDETGQTPYMYALMRNSHSYNELVARKLDDKKNNQISISIVDTEKASSRVTATARSCAQCALMDSHGFKPFTQNRGLLHRPYIHSMLAIAAVCVCVCLLMRDMAKMNSSAPFTWENLDYGPR